MTSASILHSSGTILSYSYFTPAPRTLTIMAIYSAMLYLLPQVGFARWAPSLQAGSPAATSRCLMTYATSWLRTTGILQWLLFHLRTRVYLSLLNIWHRFQERMQVQEMQLRNMVMILMGSIAWRRRMHMQSIWILPGVALRMCLTWERALSSSLSLTRRVQR